MQMIRTMIWFFYFGLSLLLTLPALVVVGRYQRAGDEQEVKLRAFRKARSWSRQLIWIAGGKIDVIGRENIPENEAYLIVSNHQSNFDIPILLGYFEHPVAFIAKVETEKIPILRNWMRYLRCIFMDRKDFRQSVKAINSGAKNLEKGYNYVIFPEGTRSSDGVLGEFKQGSVKMAMKAKVKILPITIDGSINMMRKGEKIIRPGNVRMVIHPPISSDESSADLMKRIEITIEKGFEKR
jgi:1-acyl-sn-glycerol-3-phosphate acyltransferase